MMQEYSKRLGQISADQFPTEQFIVNKLYEQTCVPVPFPYLMEPTSDIFGWSFVIMPKMPGLQVQNKDMSSQLAFNNRLEITYALARMLVEVQTLTWEFADKYAVETGNVKPFEKHYREWIVDGIREKVAAAQSCNNHTTQSDVGWIESVIAKAMPVLQTMSFWRYWQKHQNGIPGEKESLSFEEWARPSVDYWNK